MRTNIHASCVALSGGPFAVPDETGVLLLGPSGSGKSDLALRLIAAGALLVADDRTDLTLEGTALVASPPDRLAGQIEVRNLGIVTLPHCPRVPIGLAVELTPNAKLARLPEHLRWTPADGLELPESARPALVRLNPFEASAPAKVALAAAAYARGSFGAAIPPS